MNKKVGFIGAGNMATAIIDGMIKSNSIKNENIFIYDVIEENLNNIVNKNSIIPCKDNLEVLQNADVIVLAIKPQCFDDVLTLLQHNVTIDKVFVSIAAGISINYIQSKLKCKCPCVRVMPNTPMLLGLGATAICPSDNIDDLSYKFVFDMFNSSSVCEKLPEELMNTVIPVNGSSPAYIYLFAKAMIDFAIENGIDEKSATRLVCATLRGSACMIETSGETPLELINKVCSKGGTTIEAVKILETHDVYNSIKLAMEKCKDRAFELEK